MKKDKLIWKIYHKQKRSSKERNHKPPEYTLAELEQWFAKQLNFNELYINWILSGNDRDLIPSIDRIDDKLGYSFDNIRLGTFRDNYAKVGGQIMRGEIIRSGVKRNRKVNQILDNTIVNVFISLEEASRQTGIQAQNISKVCNKLRPKAGGFKWEYAN